MLEALEPGVILDRDGTLVDVVRDEETGTITPAFHPSHLRFLPGVPEGLSALRDAGFRLCIATNQPAPAKGQYSVEAVTRTNQALVVELEKLGIEIAALEVCVHHPTGGPGGDPTLVGPCRCRKPAPGMLERAMKRASLDPTRTWMVGDSRADLEAGRAAGVRVGLVYTLERCELCPLRNGPPDSPEVVGGTFDAVVRGILAAPPSRAHHSAGGTRGAGVRR
jgi:D-glycero-D-manno-heptose 1,7-bisphosphate phosphatase